MTKSELRKTYLSRQRAVPSSDRTRFSKLIARAFFTTVLPSSARVAHCFISMEKFNEVETQPIFSRLWSSFPQVRTVVPKVDFASGTMTSVRYEPEQVLGRNRWGIDEPTHDETVPAQEIDVVLVPLVAYDRSGYRVGYGKGFYDRLLAGCRTDCLKVGLSYFPPVDRIDDTQHYDIGLDRCITPELVYSFDKIRPTSLPQAGL